MQSRPSGVTKIASPHLDKYFAQCSGLYGYAGIMDFAVETLTNARWFQTACAANIILQLKLVLGYIVDMR